MKEKKWIPLLLLLPFLAMTALVLAAVAVVIIQSLGYIPAFSLHTFTLEHYAAILSGSGLLASLAVSLRIAAWSTVFAVAGGVAVAAALVYRGRTRGAMARLLRLPILVPHIVAAMFVVTIFAQTGLAARAGHALGLFADYSDFPRLLYTDSYLGAILAYLWKEIPFVAYFILSLMAGVSGKLGQAAENLGASPLRGFFHVTLPLTMPAVCNAAIIIFIFAFGGYELPLLLGSTLPRALPVQAYMDFTSPDLRDRPYAMAANGVILLLSAGMALLYWLCTRRLVKRLEGAS